MDIHFDLVSLKTLQGKKTFVMLEARSDAGD